MLKKTLLAAGLMAAVTTHAAELQITLTNATHGVYYTPVIAAAHTDAVFMFRSGSSASSEMETIAEDGDISGMTTALTNAAANIAQGASDSAPGASDGPLAPGDSVTFSLSTDDGNDYLSLSAMLLPSNDAFVGLDSWPIPTAPGTYHLNLNAYDAGTEYNDELAGSIPNPPFVTTFGNPGGSGVVTENGTGVVTSGDEGGVVHIHRGNLGDLTADGGVSDINSSLHRWLNPVARLTVVVQ